MMMMTAVIIMIIISLLLENVYDDIIIKIIFILTCLCCVMFRNKHMHTNICEISIFLKDPKRILNESVKNVLMFQFHVIQITTTIKKLKVVV